MAKYKLGDKVVISHKITNQAVRNASGCVSDMAKWAGEETIIVEGASYTTGEHIYHKVAADNGYWRWPERVLIPLEEA